ncbi:MAG: hypothetical protein IT565_01280 [Rhodospirillales bacterium]|nr:hypothetical protein [Rhodospirillales bacterium]MCC7166179.1 hypothetical protein [Rhodospirillales bacterium]
MKTLSRILVILVFLVLGAGVAFLATWDMPPPTAKVEKVIPNERFAR